MEATAGEAGWWSVCSSPLDTCRLQITLSLLQGNSLSDDAEHAIPHVSIRGLGRKPSRCRKQGPFSQRTAWPRGSWGAQGVMGCPRGPLLLSAGVSALRWGLSDPPPAQSLRGINQASVLSLFAPPLTVWPKSIPSHTTKSKVLRLKVHLNHPGLLLKGRSSFGESGAGPTSLLF